MKKRPQKKSAGWWGFEVGDIDKTVKPADNFYQYANGGWLKTAKIPADEARWGSFVTLRYDTELQLKKLVEGALKSRKAPAGSNEQLVRDVYLAATDLKRRNKLGIGPLAPLRMIVRDIKTKEQMLEVVAKFHVLGITSFFGTFVDQDAKNSSRYLLHLWQSGLGLPDRDYYLLDKPEQVRVREAYKEHIRKLLKLAGFSTASAAQAEKTILHIETQLARAAMKKEDVRDPEKIYHKKSLAELQKLSAQIDWAQYFARTQASGIKELVVGQPEFFAFVSKLIDETPLEDLKICMEWHLINGSASILSEPFAKENFRFYSTMLTGVKKMKPLWRRGLAAVGIVGESLGRMYVKEYFPPASKRAIDALVGDLFVVYEDRIKHLDWMSPATKKKAVHKLRAMNRKIGYPSKWKGYKGLEVRPEDHFGNFMRSAEFEHKRQMKKLRGSVDRTEWFMYPQTVNAYNAGSLNEIVFPAAFLQWPFFDPQADAAINYAGVGSVIGHEMTHGFDDQGAKFDYKGNMKDWWTAADKKKFEAKGKLLVGQADAYEVGDGVHLNGKLTLGENIADLGGLVIAWDAYQKYLEEHPRDKRIIDGLTPEERFFLGFAQMEREISRPEVKKMYALTDPHAAAPFRINAPLSNFDPFYEVYGVKKSDKLYRDPKKRARIW